MMDLEKRIRLFQFVIGIFRVFMNGFVELYGKDFLQIIKKWSNVNCFFYGWLVFKFL